MIKKKDIPKNSDTSGLSALFQQAAEDPVGFSAIGDFLEQNSIFSQILTFLAGLFFDKGELKFPSLADDIERSDLSAKAQRFINPHSSAVSYIQAIDSKVENIRIDGVEFQKMRFVEEDITGFKGAIYKNKDTGHSVVFFGGMATPGKEGVSADIAAGVQGKIFNQVNHQTGPAQELYLDAIRNSKSVEIVGYSLGAMLANDLAARLDAKVTNIADVGLPDVKGVDGRSMYRSDHIQNIRDNVVSLEMPGDPYIGFTGKVHGQVTMLPAVTQNDMKREGHISDEFNPVNPHFPTAYAAASEKVIAQNHGEPIPLALEQHSTP